MKTKLTQAEQLAAKLAAQDEMLNAILGFDDEQCFWLRVNEGLRFLRAECQGDLQGVEMLQSERFYWNWFINQWQIRDEQFIEMNELHELSIYELNRIERTRLRIQYEYFHANGIRGEEMSVGYQHIISEVVKKETRAINYKRKHTYEYFLTPNK